MVIRIQTRDNEPVEKALRRLRKLCNNEGVTRTSKAKAYFEKPSERRRRHARERQKAIRLSMRAKRQDVAKLLSRRRKARKAARANQRGDDGLDNEMLGAPEQHERRPSRGPGGARRDGPRSFGDREGGHREGGHREGGHREAGGHREGGHREGGAHREGHRGDRDGGPRGGRSSSTGPLEPSSSG